MLCYFGFNVKSDILFAYDDCSSMTALCRKDLFKVDSIFDISPVRVRNSSETYSRINKKGVSYGMGEVYYDPSLFMSIVCAYDLEHNDNFELKCVLKEGKRIGYDIRIKDIAVDLSCRWIGKLMIGSFEPLVNYIEKLNSESVFLTKDMKSAAALKTMSKIERDVNRVRRIQHRMGMMSDQHAGKSVRFGYFKNLPVPEKAFANATAVAGVDVSIAKGKGTIDRKMTYEDFVPMLGDGELCVEIDIGYLGIHGFLIGVSEPFSFGVAIYLGKGEGHKNKGNLLRACKELNRIIRKYGWKTRHFLYDAEKSLAKDELSLKSFLIPDILFDEDGITCTSLPTGVHAKRVENKIKHWKNKIRSRRFSLLYTVPPSWMHYFGVAAMNWCNIDLTVSNTNMTPPMVCLTGEPIDYNHWCIASFGEVVLAHKDNDLMHNSTELERRSECIYLHPNSTKFSHKLLVIDSIESRLATLDRKLKHTDVLPSTSLSTVARVNNQARKEINQLKKRGISTVEFEDFMELTGYREDLLVDTPLDLLKRDSRTSSISTRAEESVEEDIYFSENLDVECFDSFTLDVEIHNSFLTKKELRYSIAASKYGVDRAANSIKKELLGLIEGKVWHPVITWPKDMTVLPTQALVRPKMIDGKEELKGRLVGGGHKDPTEYDIYREVSAPTARLSSFFAVACYAASKNLRVMTFDVSMAFIKAPMSGKSIYVRLDRTMVQLLQQVDSQTDYTSFIRPDGTMVVQLDKALYGCLQSARLWYDHFAATLVKIGYVVCPHDACIFNKFGEQDDIISTLVIHVDDGFVSAISENDLDMLQESLTNELKQVKFHRGRVHNYLGMKLDFTTLDRVEITIDEYIHELIRDWKVSKTRDTPARDDLFSIDSTSIVLSNEKKKRLHSGIAKLLYLATHIRPDVLCATIFLTSRVRELTQQDESKFLDVIAYLNKTSHLGIVLGVSSDGQLRALCFADASFAVHPDARGHAGIIFSYGRGPILTRSYKIKTNTLSTAETELMVASDGVSATIGEVEFAKYMKYMDDKEPAILMEDNISTIHMANHGKPISHRTRHIKVRHFFIKQYLDNGEIRLVHCPTLLQVADILTKPLQGKLFCDLRDKLLGYNDMIDIAMIEKKNTSGKETTGQKESY